MGTIVTSKDLVKGIMLLKAEDKALDEGDRKLDALVNIVNMDEDFEEGDKEEASSLGMSTFTMSEVIKAGQENSDFKVTEPGFTDCYMFLLILLSFNLLFIIKEHIIQIVKFHSFDIFLCRRRVDLHPFSFWSCRCLFGHVFGLAFTHGKLHLLENVQIELINSLFGLVSF